MDEGFGSVRDLYEKARKVDVGITLEMVSTWMRAQPNKQTRNYKNYNSYTAPFPKYEFQIDLMDVTSLLRDVGSEIKRQLRYGLICIDIFSKTRWSPRTRMLTRMLLVQMWKHMDMQSRTTLSCNRLFEQSCSYFPCYQSAVWSGKCRVWSVKCGVWSAECKVRSAKYKVWSGECRVCKVWSVECAVGSVEFVNCRV